jgi:dihydroneopterin aldolase/2-amino-4-hydroxy-6-hydroxymethyldihydropteridine diphosphokinase
VPDEPVDVVLALGSNLGSSQAILRRAVSGLDALAGLEVVTVAPLARTAAVGGPAQADYLNTVVLARTTLSPRALLRACQGLEAAEGRERSERWGPRTLDIDIVVYGSTLAVSDDLELPHPRAHERAFVLEPWAQVAPGAVLPGLGGGPVAALATTAPDREGIRWLALDWWGRSEAT